MTKKPLYDYIKHIYNYFEISLKLKINLQTFA